MNMRALFNCPPPVNPSTLSIAGSRRTTSMNCVSFCFMASKEMLWSPCTKPTMRPMSCSGKNAFGITMYRKKLRQTVSSSSIIMNRPCASAQCSVRS